MLTHSTMFRRTAPFAEGKKCIPKLKTRFLKIVILTVLVLLSPINTSAQAPNLGVLSNFALYTSNGALSNAFTSNISGSVGAHIGSVSGFVLPTIVVQSMLVKLIMLLSVTIPKLLAPFDSLNFKVFNFYISFSLKSFNTIIKLP